MTLEQLLNLTGDELAAKTDTELLDYFAPFLPTTRPDTGKIERKEKKHIGKPKSNYESQMQEVLELMAEAKKIKSQQ